MKTNEQTEEAANDVFVKVFQKLQLYDTNRSFSIWITRITINHCIELLRVKKNRFLTEDLREEIEYDEADFTDLIDEVPMLPLIKDLPPKYRMVFNLYVIEDYSHTEIAKLLEISVGTSKSNLSRAKKLILKRISNNPHYSQLRSKRI